MRGTRTIKLLSVGTISVLMTLLAMVRGSAQETRQWHSSAADNGTRAAIITLEGVIDDYSRDALFKRFAEARRLGANVVILKLNTPGGLVTAGLDVSQFLKQQTDLHTIAYVHHKAYSAGIMVGLACNELVMEPGAYIGDSAPIVMDPAGGLQTLGSAERAKAESPILADFYDSAVKNGYDPLLAEAMVSYGRTVHWIEYAGAPGAPLPLLLSPGEGRGEGGSGANALTKSSSSQASTRPHPNPLPAGEGTKARRFVDTDEFAKLTSEGWREVREPGVPTPIDGGETLLTVSADVATKIGLSREIVSSPEQFAASRGYTIVADLAPGGGERFVEFLSNSAVRGVLLAVFLMSVYIALHTPGAGAAEAAGMITLCALIGVPLLTGYAQWWEIAAILVGICLLALELFVIPGFGVAGVVGIILVVGGLVMTFVGNSPGMPGAWRLPQVWTGLLNGLLAVVVAFAATGVMAVWVRKYLPKLPYLNRLVLQTPGGGLTMSDSGVASQPVDAWPFVGTIGLAVSELKPGGSAEFPYADDRRITAVISDSGFVNAGTKIVVREVQGNRVIVRPVNV